MSKKTEPYDIPGYKTPIRCHRCGTSKGEEDIGTHLHFLPIDSKQDPTKPTLANKVWFHSEECEKLWRDDNEDKIIVINISNNPTPEVIE